MRWGVDGAEDRSAPRSDERRNSPERRETGGKQGSYKQAGYKKSGYRTAGDKGGRGPKDRWSDERRESRDRHVKGDRFGGDRSRDDRSRDDRGPRREWGDRGRDGRGRDDRGKREWGNRSDRGPRRDRDDRRESRGGRPFEDARSFDSQEAFDDGADVMAWSPDTAEPSHHVNPATTAATTETTFTELGVPAVLAAELSARGIEHPFPIQEATIPDALRGRDILGRGRTGSGKTLGFGLPLVARLMEDTTATARRGRSPRGLILVPTRELALQVADVVAPLARAAGLEVILVAGGMAYGPQIKAFRSGVDIVVATPGRLIDLMKQDAADLTEAEITVLDEADHMADLGFLPDVTTLLDATPAGGQRLLFSATLDRGVDKVVKKYLNDPLTHEVDSAQASVTTMTHAVLHLLPHDKNAATAAICNREGRTVVFVRTQRGADRVAGQLREAGVMAGALHGGLTQGARSRVLLAFREGSVPVLVATDVAARGIHVDDVSLVLQVDPPMGPKDYLHRAGRTARAGNAGVVATIVLPHQRRQTDRLLRDAGIKVEPMRTHPTDEALAEMTGARAPHAEPILETDYLKLIAPRKPERGPKRGPGGFKGRGRGGHGGRGHGGRGGRGGRGGPRSHSGGRRQFRG